MIRTIEELMYQMSDFFMAPVLILLVLMFAYSLFAFGQFVCQTAQRRRHKISYRQSLQYELGQAPAKFLPGYPLVTLAQQLPSITKDQLDVAALEDMEGVRTASRLAPMLGLIATMVPMGPALKSLADGNVQGISENLIVAFSAVIFGLVIASITFWIASVKRRWLAAELVALTPLLKSERLVAAAVSASPATRQEVACEVA
jgi:biopolymer transport protein ExbB/TolQ